MMAMRYGCIPIVRRTGGLVDTVIHHDPMNQAGTGYCFDRYEPLDLFTCMVRASEGFVYKDRWQQLQQRAMSQDFSWVKSALEYIKIYKEITGQSRDLTADEPRKTRNADRQRGITQTILSWNLKIYSVKLGDRVEYACDRSI